MVLVGCRSFLLLVTTKTKAKMAERFGGATTTYSQLAPYANSYPYQEIFL